MKNLNFVTHQLSLSLLQSKNNHSIHYSKRLNVEKHLTNHLFFYFIKVVQSILLMILHHNLTAYCFFMQYHYFLCNTMKTHYNFSSSRLLRTSNDRLKVTQRHSYSIYGYISNLFPFSFDFLLWKNVVVLNWKTSEAVSSVSLVL